MKLARSLAIVATVILSSAPVTLATTTGATPKTDASHLSGPGLSTETAWITCFPPYGWC
jgi:hypothetical protein